MKTIFITLLLITGTAFAQVNYNRNDWRHWEDFDRDCQNTRQELLISTSLAPATFTNARNCTVATGLWIGPYTGEVFTQASDVDIDHIIPLNYAHDHGGALWSPLLKKVFANDPDNLLVTQDNANQSKSDRGPSQYMPPLEAYRCEYMRRWKFLVAKYELAIDKADSDLIALSSRVCRQ